MGRQYGCVARVEEPRRRAVQTAEAAAEDGHQGVEGVAARGLAKARADKRRPEEQPPRAAQPAAHRGEDTLTRRLFASGTSGLKTSESSWRVEPAEQSRGLNPFAEAMRAHPDGTMGPVGTVDLLNIPGQHPDAYSNRIWHHYVTREPGAFDQHDVFAKNRYLLRIFPPSSGGLMSEADEL